MLDTLPKDVYTHGLELIYTLQDVDVKSIRVFGSAQSAQNTPQTNLVPFPIPLNREEQLEFSFGSIFDQKIPSFLALEPINVLALSRQAEKHLLDSSLSSLGLVQKADLKSLGFGQGHIDEIHHKLEHYLDGRTLGLTDKVDYISWLRSLIVNVDRKKAYVALEGYQLQDVVLLSPAESVEVRRATNERKSEWVQDFMQQMQRQDSIAQLTSAFKIVTDACLRPWMITRLGIATEDELLERLQRLGEDSVQAAAFLHLIRDIYNPYGNVIGKYLVNLESGVYAESPVVARDFNSIISLAISYLIPSSPAYTLDQLITYISHEYALNWRDFHEGFIEKALSYSKIFRIRKNFSGDKIIRKYWL